MIAIKDATVTAKTEIELIREAGERLAEKIRNDPVFAKEFRRKVFGPERRALEGAEKEHMLTVFRLIEPIENSNNQHVFTDVYEHAGKVYHVHYFDETTEVEEILPDEES